MLKLQQTSVCSPRIQALSSSSSRSCEALFQSSEHEDRCGFTHTRFGVLSLNAKTINELNKFFNKLVDR